MVRNEVLGVSELIMPKARTEGLVVQNFEDDLLVFDMNTNKAHCLNSTSKLIWHTCDGKTEINKVVENINKEFNTDLNIDFVLMALEKLDDAKLIQNRLNKNHLPKVSRRHLIGKYAMSALSLPIIMSLVTPTAAQMGSCLATGQSGCNTTPCCPNNTCQAVVGPGGIITNICVATP